MKGLVMEDGWDYTMRDGKMFTDSNEPDILDFLEDSSCECIWCEEAAEEIKKLRRANESLTIRLAACIDSRREQSD